MIRHRPDGQVALPPVHLGFPPIGARLLPGTGQKRSLSPVEVGVCFRSGTFYTVNITHVGISPEAILDLFLTVWA